MGPRHAVRRPAPPVRAMSPPPVRAMSPPPGQGDGGGGGSAGQVAATAPVPSGSAPVAR